MHQQLQSVTSDRQQASPAAQIARYQKLEVMRSTESSPCSSFSMQHHNTVAAASVLYTANLRSPGYVQVTSGRLQAGTIFRCVKYALDDTLKLPGQIFQDMRETDFFSQADAALQRGEGDAYRVMQVIGSGGQCQVRSQTSRCHPVGPAHAVCTAATHLSFLHSA